MPHSRVMLGMTLLFTLVILWPPGQTGWLTNHESGVATSLINRLFSNALGSISLEINRVELYFENHRAEITTERNFSKLKAYALIRLTGSGLLQGYWKIDDQIFSQFSQHVTAGQPVILETPEVSPLPTFNLGTHLVRLEITSPSSNLPLPTALYFVTPSGHRTAPLKIALKSPPKNSINKYQPQGFKWEALHDSTVYLIEFYDRVKDAPPIFSAYTRKPGYILDDLCLSKICEIGKTYYWKVKGFDEQKTIVGESDLWRFSFKE